MQKFFAYLKFNWYRYLFSHNE